MERRARYEPVPTDEETEPATQINVAMVTEEPGLRDSPPPAYDGGTSVGTNPPSYDIATDLPTYEEAERSKKEMEREEDDYLQELHLEGPPLPTRQEGLQVGTDCMFFLSFLICLTFNWFGVLLVLCAFHTVAGRSGAIAGFGLSMVKWAIIIKHNEWGTNYVAGDSVIWWIMVALGFLLFLNGIGSYVRIRHQLRDGRHTPVHGDGRHTPVRGWILNSY